MKNRIVGIGVTLFLFVFIFIVIGTNRDPNHFNDVTEMSIKIMNYSTMNKTTTKSLRINNPEAIKQLVKPFKKFEFSTQKTKQETNEQMNYEIKMNNGYTLTFNNNWNNFEQNCHATLNGTDLEQCAPKDFFLQIINIIKENI